MAENKPVPTPSSAPSPKTGTKSPSEAAASAASTVPSGTTSGKIGLTGVPIGTPITTGYTQGPKGVLLGNAEGIIPVTAKTQYSAGSGTLYFATLSNKEKIDLLSMLAQIPGAYEKNQAPTAPYLRNLASTKTIALRPEDKRAIEKVMYYSDSVGEDVGTSVKKLYNNPSLAQGYFDIAANAPKKIDVTPAEALSAELTASFNDYLDTNPDKEVLKAYVKEVQDAEKKRQGSLTSLERNNILLNFVQAAAAHRFSGDKAPDSALLQAGALGSTYNTIRQSYDKYLLPVDDKKVYQQAIEGIRSKQALDNILNKVALQAKALYPSVANVIDAGGTVADALDPYKTAYSKIYGIPANEIKKDELYQVLSGKELMPMADWIKYLYSKPEYKKTQDYMDKSFADAQVLLRNFNIG